MASYTKMTVGKENRTELHEKLALTGAEISLKRFLREQMFRLSTPTRKMRKSTVFFPAKARSLSMAKKSALQQATG